jgi:hypothetical protein
MLSVLGPDHADVSTVRSNAGDALLGLRRYAEATEEYGRALRIRAARSGTDHRKAQRLLEKIRVAAQAAAAAQAAQKREEEEAEGAEKEAEEVEEPQQIQEPQVQKQEELQNEQTKVTGSPTSSAALSVETLQRWFGETDVRDFCLLTDDRCDSDEEEDDNDALGNLKLQLESDLDRIANIGHDLDIDVMKEQAAFLEEMRKMDDDADDNDADPNETENDNEGGGTCTNEVSSSIAGEKGKGLGEAPRRIRSAADANDAVREVRERLGRVRARNHQMSFEDGIDALRRVPVSAPFGNTCM